VKVPSKSGQRGKSRFATSMTTNAAQRAGGSLLKRKRDRRGEKGPCPGEKIPRGSHLQKRLRLRGGEKKALIAIMLRGGTNRAVRKKESCEEKNGTIGKRNPIGDQWIKVDKKWRGEISLTVVSGSEVVCRGKVRRKKTTPIKVIHKHYALDEGVFRKRMLRGGGMEGKKPSRQGGEIAASLERGKGRGAAMPKVFRRKEKGRLRDSGEKRQNAQKGFAMASTSYPG